MEWMWDEDKARANLAKHGVPFSNAVLALRDPLRAYQADPHEDGDRWRTLGRVGPGLLVVIHTWPELGYGRIISARRASKREWRTYEQARPA